MAITQKHVINIQPGVSAPLVIHCSQGDTGTQINLTVVNGDEEFDCSSYACSVHGTRSDRANWGPVTCNVSGSTVSFSLTSEMTAVAGACLAEISVGTVGTANFAMLMENATFENGVTYSNDVSVYQNILTAVQAGISNEKNERIAAVTNEKNERVNADNSLSSRISQNDARINNLVGSTGNSNSEIVDARVGEPSIQEKTYTTLGEAIRAQVGDLQEHFNDIYPLKILANFDNIKTYGPKNIDYITNGKSWQGTIAIEADYTYGERLTIIVKEKTHYNYPNIGVIEYYDNNSNILKTEAISNNHGDTKIIKNHIDSWIPTGNIKDVTKIRVSIYGVGSPETLPEAGQNGYIHGFCVFVGDISIDNKYIAPHLEPLYDENKDGRIDNYGHTYSNLGTSIRKQILQATPTTIVYMNGDNLFEKTNFSNIKIDNHLISVPSISITLKNIGKDNESTITIVSNIIPIIYIKAAEIESAISEAESNIKALVSSEYADDNTTYTFTIKPSVAMVYDLVNKKLYFKIFTRTPSDYVVLLACGWSSDSWYGKIYEKYILPLLITTVADSYKTDITTSTDSLIDSKITNFGENYESSFDWLANVSGVKAYGPKNIDYITNGKSWQGTIAIEADYTYGERLTIIVKEKTHYNYAYIGVIEYYDNNGTRLGTEHFAEDYQGQSVITNYIQSYTPSIKDTVTKIRVSIYGVGSPETLPEAGQNGYIHGFCVFVGAPKILSPYLDSYNDSLNNYYDNVYSDKGHNFDTLYLPVLWKNNINNIIEKMSEHESSITFALQSDTHYRIGEYKNPGIKLAQLSRHVPFDFIGNIGDVIQGYDFEKFDQPDIARESYSRIVGGYLDNPGCPVLFAFGNHDSNIMYARKYNEKEFSYRETYNYLFKPIYNKFHQLTHPAGKKYYYFDTDRCRIIVLDTNEYTDNSISFTITSNQIEWFKTTALDTKLPVIVMSHVPLIGSLSENKSAGADSIVSALENFKVNGGTILCCIAGHVHDQKATIQNGIQYICLTQAFSTNDNLEIFMVDFDMNTITTIGLGNVQNRSFTF